MYLSMKDSSRLHFFSRYRSAEVALLLIQHGANLNKADTSGVTPLHLACNRAETGVVNSILGSDDSGVDSCDFRAMSPLHHAALSGDLGIIKVLIAHGANIFATNNRGETPLHLSSGENSIQAAKILIDTCE